MNNLKSLSTRYTIVFFVFLLALLSSRPTMAQDCSEQTVQLTLPESWTLQQGDQFCFNVEVSNFNDIILFFFVINFNSTVLQLDSWDPTVSGLTGFTAGDVTAPTDRDPDVIRILWSHPNLDASSLPNNSALLELCFTVIGEPGNDGQVLFNDTGLGSPAEFLNEASLSFRPCNPNPDNGRVIVVPEESDEPQVFTTGLCGSSNTTDEGIVELKVFFGTPPYTIVSTQGNMVGTDDQDVFVYTGLPLGQHTFSVVDDTGLNSQNLTIEITDDPAFTIEASTLKAPNCPTDFNGRIELEISGGKPFSNGAYFYDWGTAQIGLGQNELKDLSNGIYEVTVIDSLGCKQSTQFELLRTVIDVQALNITDALCDGRNNGAINVGATGGGPFSDGYTWNIERVEEDGSITPINNASDRGFEQEFRLLSPGNYRITATDSVDRFSSCGTMGEFVIGVQREITATFAPIDESNNPCTGGTVEAIIELTTTMPPLTTPVNVQILDSMGVTVYDEAVNEASINIGCLPPGRYTSLVSEPNDGCTNTQELLLQSNSILLNDTTLISPTCFGESDGSITIDVSSDMLPLNYTWSNGASGADVDSIGGLSAGVYSVIVMDASGAEQTYQFDLSDPEEISLDLLVLNDIMCPGGLGNLIASVTGGTSDLTFTWLPDTLITSSAVLNDVPAGEYSVIVTDINGCSSQNTVILNDKIAPIPNLSNINPPGCTGEASGTAVLTISPSVDFAGPFFFESSTGTRGSVNNFTVTNFPPGPDNFIIYGQGDCIFDTVFVEVPDALPFEIDTVNTLITEIACFGDSENNGANVNLSLIGPNSLDIRWLDDGSMGNVRIGLAAGIYPIELSVGTCAIMDTIIIPQPDSLAIQIDTINSIIALCGGDNNTELTIDVEGGTPDYNITWTNEDSDIISTGLNAVDLVPGVYTIEVLDQNGCDASIEASVTEPDIVVATLSEVSDPICSSDQGFLTIGEVNGGIGAPYRYQVNTAPAIPVSDTALIIPGDITVRVFDQNGCSWDTTLTITQPLDLSVNIGADREVELGQSTQVTALIETQSAIDTILWSPSEIVECTLSNCAEVSVSPIGDALLSVQVIDENGCIVEDNINVNVQRTSNIYIPNAFAPNATVPGNATFKVFGGSGIAAVDFIKVFDRYGNLVHSEDGPQAIQLSGVGNWNGYFNNDQSKELETGVYMYVVQFSFIDGGAPEIRSGNVTLIR